MNVFVKKKKKNGKKPPFHSHPLILWHSECSFVTFSTYSAGMSKHPEFMYDSVVWKKKNKNKKTPTLLWTTISKESTDVSVVYVRTEKTNGEGMTERREDVCVEIK